MTTESTQPGVRPMVIMGGRQKRIQSMPTPEWSRFGQAVVLSLDPQTQELEENFCWETPEEARPDEGASVVFKSGTRRNGLLYLCTQTEVLLLDEESMSLKTRISLPIFNDVHHVTPTSAGTLLVVSTGLDLVVELTEDGELVREWSTAETPTWERFDRSVDYRKVLTTKPHQSHPNHVFEYRGDYWVTRFEQKDLCCLTSPEKGFDFHERPHDGYLVDDAAWVTTVDSHLFEVDLATGSQRQEFDIAEISESAKALGWMRGCSIVGSTAYLGFSTLRITKFRQNVRWVKKRFGQIDADSIEPTHVAAYDLDSRSLLWRRELDSPKLDIVFSVLA